jgi:hypothetical protein
VGDVREDVGVSPADGEQKAHKRIVAGNRTAVKEWL